MFSDALKPALMLWPLYVCVYIISSVVLGRKSASAAL